MDNNKHTHTQKLAKGIKIAIFLKYNYFKFQYVSCKERVQNIR